MAPPTSIAGIYDRPTSPLEFSRGWLSKAEKVRLRRAELQAAGLLSGLAPEHAAERGAALQGTLRVPVVLVRYADVDAPFGHEVVADRLFGVSRGDSLSYSHYWHEVSGGLLTVAGAVTPWIRLPKEAAHYLPSADYGWSRFGRMTGFRGQVIAAADRMLDFGQYDNDGPDGVPNSGDDDGYVDFIAFLYATDCRGDWRSGAIWPHRGAMPPRETEDAAAAGGRIKVADYVILPAVEPGSCRPLDIGVLAHETGHAFGLPDLYDYDGSSQGIGAWGLMGSGSHSAPHSPAHPSAWEKEQLGWVRVDWLDGGDERLRLAPVASERAVARYDIPGARGTYLLFENRMRIGSDRELPGDGLLVWHVDPERGELGAWNGDERRAAVSLLEADGRGNLRRGEKADAGDPFPGPEGRSTFTWAGAGGFALRGIHRDAYGMVWAETTTAEAPVAEAAPLTAPAPPVPARGPSVIAHALPWSWGLAAQDGRVLQASYGWDPLGLRPRPRLLELRPDAPVPETLARLPAEALYSPVAAADGGAYVLARAREENFLYHVGADGAAALVARGLGGGSPAYGAAALPGGGLLVAYWNGRIDRIDASGAVRPWAQTLSNLYQIATDGSGTAYATTFAGTLLRIEPEGRTRITPIETGFGPGGLVAVAASATGVVFAAERGGEGRILRIEPDGQRTIVARVANAEFYGLAVHDGALYALDLAHRQLLRLPLDERVGALVAGRLAASGAGAADTPQPRDR